MLQITATVSLTCLAALLAGPVRALDLGLPTPNDALLRPGHDADFFQPTVEGTVESGMFGCVRSAGRRFHEGVDIKCLTRDRRGEPVDPVRAVAAGRVAFINAKPGLSNYGRYLVLAHRWDGVEVYTLYAHLREIAPGLAAGQSVAKGQRLAILGHTSNTREGISRDRAHLHFEVDLLYSPHFHLWFPKHDLKAPPFGDFNGKNLIGMDPAALLREAAANPTFNFADHIARQPVAFTVLVRGRPFPWLTLHPEQVQPLPAAPPGDLAAYEIGFTSWGLPVSVSPRGPKDLTDTQRHFLQRGFSIPARINEETLARGNCERLVQRARAGRGWQLSPHGQELLDLLTYTP